MARVIDDSHYVESNGVGIFVSQSFCSEAGLSHGFTTRIGGISKPPFDALNLGTSRDEPYENILANYKILSKAFGLDYDQLALVRHEHGDHVVHRVKKKIVL